MAVRKKRSVSIPPDLDTQIEAAAAEAGVTYSAWLSATARKEFTIRAGLDAVAEFEREHGAYTFGDPVKQVALSELDEDPESRIAG